VAAAVIVVADVVDAAQPAADNARALRPQPQPAAAAVAGDALPQLVAASLAAVALAVAAAAELRLMVPQQAHSSRRRCSCLS